MKLIKIEEIKKKKYNGLVYDLTVRGQHSYNINGVIVHNSACITTSNTGIHYPLASLISECFEESLKLEKPAFIVADGGIRGYSDINKALALGADYVMCGSVFSKMLESAGETFMIKSKLDDEYVEVDNIPTNQYSRIISNSFKKGDIKLIKKYYGMSTRKAQVEINGSANKTSEGIEKILNVEYTMSQWSENFIDYLKSAMSYTSSFGLGDYIGNVETIIVSNNSYNSVNK